MWQQIVSWARLLWDTGEEVQRLRAEVRDLQLAQSDSNDLMRALATQSELLHREIQHEREKRADELEKIELRLRLQMSEELRRLPPGESRAEH